MAERGARVLVLETGGAGTEVSLATVHRTRIRGAVTLALNDMHLDA
jgi:hypothetical protein